MKGTGRLLTIAAIACALGVGPARASGVGSPPIDFDFSFIGTGDLTGTVSGEIFGLQDNTANQAATDVVITASSIGSPSGFPLDLNALGATPSVNSFSVSAGEMVAASYDFVYDQSGEEVVLELNQDSANEYLWMVAPDPEVANFEGFGGVTYGAAAVPEPASLSLLAASLAGLGLLRRLGRRAMPDRIGA